MIRLNRTYYSLLKFSQAKLLKNWVFWAKFKQIKAKSAQFAYILCVFQAPAPAENFQKFQRIMQIPRSSLT